VQFVEGEMLAKPGDAGRLLNRIFRCFLPAEARLPVEGSRASGRKELIQSILKYLIYNVLRSNIKPRFWLAKRDVAATSGTGKKIPIFASNVFDMIRQVSILNISYDVQRAAL
jgi:hypothetical protein